MAWVPGFDNDVFLSYARVDNATPDGDPSRGWVAQFHRHLAVALSKRVGRLDVIDIWRDTREVAGNKLFDATIQGAITRSAVFVALTSPGYLHSEYCRQELEWFHRKAGLEPQGLAAGDDYRICNLLLSNVPRAKWPQEFGRTAGFPFHDADDVESGEGEPSAVGGERFARQVRAAAQAVFATLQRMAEAAAPPAPPDADASRRVTVFLADTSDSLRSIRKRALVELAQCADVEVIAGVPPPFESGDHDARVREVVAAADLSVHLLDALPGRDVVGCETVGYPQRQAELALEQRTAQLVWVPKDLAVEEVESESYRAFLDRLENGPREDRHYEFHRDLPSAVPQQLLAVIDALRAKRLSTPPEETAQAVLLDTHFKDQLHALELSRYLIAQNLQPYINPQEDDPGRNLTVFTERLKQAGILILFCGAVADEWLRARLGVVLKIAIAEDCPLRACGVYLAPPRAPDRAPTLRLPLLPIEWMDHTAGFNPAAVDHLIARARQAGGFLES
jgi:hypothetical protein